MELGVAALNKSPLEEQESSGWCQFLTGWVAVLLAKLLLGWGEEILPFSNWNTRVGFFPLGMQGMSLPVGVCN